MNTAGCARFGALDVLRARAGACAPAAAGTRPAVRCSSSATISPSSTSGPFDAARRRFAAPATIAGNCAVFSLPLRDQRRTGRLPSPPARSRPAPGCRRTSARRPGPALQRRLGQRRQHRAQVHGEIVPDWYRAPRPTTEAQSPFRDARTCELLDLEMRYPMLGLMFRRKASGLASVFGALELRVLDALWRRARGRPCATCSSLPGRRLHHADDDDGAAAPEGRAGAAQGRPRVRLPAGAGRASELESGLVTRALQPLLRGGSAQPILSCFVDEVSRQDERLLDELERLVREKRRQQEERAMTYWLLAAVITLSAFAVVRARGVGRWSRLAGVRADAPRSTRYAPARAGARAVPAPRAAGRAAPRPCAFGDRAADLPRGSRTGTPTSRSPHAARSPACAGAFLLLARPWRAAAAWRATAAFVRDWQRRGRRLARVDAPVPVFAIDEPFPTVAVVGVSRPVLFIAERVLRECTADEVARWSRTSARTSRRATT